jgi:hypothetical protein
VRREKLANNDLHDLTTACIQEIPESTWLSLLRGTRLTLGHYLHKMKSEGEPSVDLPYEPPSSCSDSESEVQRTYPR